MNAELAYIKNQLLDGKGAKLMRLNTRRIGNVDQEKIAFGLPANIEPLESEMLAVPVRAISAGLITSFMIDLSMPDVLKYSVPFLKKTKIYTDHWVETGTVVGKVADAEWSNDGERPGINAVLSVDTVVAPMLARKILGGLIDSVSIGFVFEWKQSHNMEFETFVEMLGHEVDGELVRIVVTKIVDIYEISFVWEGADPYAKVIGDIRQINSNFEKLQIPSELNYNFRNKNSEVDMVDNMNREIEKLHAQVAEFEKSNSKLLAENQEISKKFEQLQATVAELQAKAAFGVEQIEQMRAETKRLAALFRVDGESDTMDMIIANADPEMLRKLHADYSAKADRSVPLTCQDCGSHNVMRRSSLGAKTDDSSGSSRGNFNPIDFRG